MNKTLKVMMALLSLVIIMTIISPLKVSAEEGDLYNKYKAEFDSAALDKNFLKMVKDYDSETNSFNCGSFSANCQITSAIYTPAIGLVKMASSGLNSMVMNPTAITKDEIFIKYKNYVTGLANSLLVLFIIWHVMIMMLRRFGDSDDYPQAMNQKMLGMFGGAVMLALYDTIFSQIMTMNHDITSGILESGVDADRLAFIILAYGPLYSIIFGIFVGLIFIIFLVALTYRFVALGFFFITGPVAITTIMNEEFNYFKVWIRYVVNSVVTLFLQSLSFVLAVKAITNEFSYTKTMPYGVDVIMGFMLAVAFCFFALMIPGLLGNLGSSTGTGRGVGRIVRLAMRR